MPGSSTVSRSGRGQQKKSLQRTLASRAACTVYAIREVADAKKTICGRTLLSDFLFSSWGCLSRPFLRKGRLESFFCKPKFDPSAEPRTHSHLGLVQPSSLSASCRSDYTLATATAFIINASKTSRKMVKDFREK